MASAKFYGTGRRKKSIARVLIQDKVKIIIKKKKKKEKRIWKFKTPMVGVR